jgi:hypothetical protein
VIVPFHSEERRVLIDAIRRRARLVQVGWNRDIMPGGGTTALGTMRCIATRVAAIHPQSENILCMKVGRWEGRCKSKVVVVIIYAETTTLAEPFEFVVRSGR